MNKNDTLHAPGRNDIIQIRINFYSIIKNLILIYVKYVNQQCIQYNSIQSIKCNALFQHWSVVLRGATLIQGVLNLCPFVQVDSPRIAIWCCNMYKFDTCHELNFMICILLSFTECNGWLIY